MKRIICTVLTMLMCFSFFSAEAFAAKDKNVKTGLKAEKISSFDANDSDDVVLVNTTTPLVAIYDKTGKVSLVDAKGKAINEKSYYAFLDTSAELSEKDILIVVETENEEDYKYGLLCADGTELCDCKYDDIAIYDGELCVLVTRDKDEYLIDELVLFNLVSKETYPMEIPEELIGLPYSDLVCKLSEDGYVHLGAEVSWDEKYLFVYNPKGNLVFSEVASSELEFHTTISDSEYSGFFSIGDDLYNDKGELISSTPAIINALEKEWELIMFYDNGGYGLMDMEGKVLCNSDDTVISFTGEYGCIEKDGKCGLINKNAELLTELVYDKIDLAENGFATAMKDGHVGFINNEGKEITDFIFDKECYGWRFTEYGNCLVLKDGKLGMIDQAGKYIVKPEIEEKNAYADQYSGYIKYSSYIESESVIFYMRSGAVVSAEWGKATDNPDLFEVKEKDKTALIDYGGNVLVKHGENSEYIAIAGSEYVLGLNENTVNVYKLVSK